MLTVGLIGCGAIAQRAHIPALQRLHSTVHVARVCDVRDESARRVANILECASTTDYRAVVEDPKIDAVVICTPEFLHAEQAVAAANSGKHVLCEKPMARTLAEADSMIAAAESAHVRLMIAHSRRFTPRYQRAYELVQAGAVGVPVLVRENERRQRVAPAAPSALPAGWRPDPTKETTWYSQARYAEGTVFHIGVHEMDLLRWFAGADAESVFMHSKISGPGRKWPTPLPFRFVFATASWEPAIFSIRLLSGIPITTSWRSLAQVVWCAVAILIRWD